MNRLIITLLLVLFTSASFGQKSKKSKRKDKQAVETSNKSKANASVIENANSDTGLFKVYEKNGNYYFEIPDSLTNRDMLIVNKVSKVSASLNDAGINKGMNFDNTVVQFVIDKKQEKVFVKKYKPFIEVEETSHIKRSVDANYSKSIIEYFDIEQYSADKKAVIIKVNKIYDGSSTSFNNIFGNTGIGTSVIKNFSYIKTIKSYPLNIVAKSIYTTKVQEATTSLNLTVKVTSNLVLLPKKPMNPRFEDDRVGYFTCPRWYFNDKQHGLEKREIVTRWRLEPKDKAKYFRGELCEPIKPIVFYIDPATPKQWVKYIKQGINDWQKAFEHAGFKNAIIAKEASDNLEDFDIDDVRYSTVTYVASEKSNAMGPSVFDPRSGEIIESDVIWWHNVMTSVQSWMRVQTGVIDPKSRPNVFSDQHMGEAIRFVSSHEIGHTLGLKHNMGASYSYPVDSLRSEHFCKTHATAPSIMDYARFNYVAQPEDNVTHIMPSIGVYDKFAINWAYRYFPEQNAWKEATKLQEMTTKAYKDPMCHYLPQQDMRAAIDPRAQSEDIGNDAVKASTYGLKNLKRIMPQIISWTTKAGDTYSEAGQLLNAVIGQWHIYSYHVLTNVGGVYLNSTRLGDNNKTFTFVEKQKQKDAVKFLIKNVIEYPDFLFNGDIYNYVYPLKSSPKGYQEYSPFALFKNMQSYIMWDLLTNKRIDRMIANEMKNGNKAYTAIELINDLHNAIFKKTIAGKPLNISDRAMQKSYIDALIIAVDRAAVSKEKKKALRSNNNSAISLSSTLIFEGPKRISEAISVKRGELIRIQSLLKSKKNIADMASKFHYEDLLLRINYSLGEI